MSAKAASNEVRRARAYLSRVAEAPAPALAEFVAQVGPVQAADLVRRGEVPDRVADETGARRGVDRSMIDLADAAAAGARLLVPEDPEWPSGPFAALGSRGGELLAPPLALWVRGSGRLDGLAEGAVAVVGARAATSYGLHVAAQLGEGLAASGRTVVSGAAIGIDGAAHRGALAAAGPSVAVLACGIERAYPAAHQGLLERISKVGLVITEYPPGAVPARHRFLVRNRLIAALTEGTVVVEAGLRSGAQRTAADALALGRVVMAVPGPVTSGMSAGCHRLLREGAVLVTRTEEVLEAVGRLGHDLAPELVQPASTDRPTDGLGKAAALVYDALPTRAARDVCWLALEAGLPPDVVRAALVDLERRELVTGHDGRWCRRLDRRRRTASPATGPP